MTITQRLSIIKLKFGYGGNIMKKIISVLLVLVLLITCIPLEAISTSAACALPLPNYPAGTWYGSGQCWSFANLVYQNYWGYAFSNSQYTNDNLIRDIPINASSRQATAANLKKYISQCPIGSCVRISRTLDYVSQASDGDLGHSFIVVNRDANGFTCYDIMGGYVCLNYRTYDYYATYIYLSGGLPVGSAYIKYIKAGSGGSISTPTLANLGTNFYAYIKNAGSGKNFSINNFSSDGGIVYMNSQLSSSSIYSTAGQHWKFVRQSDGSYRIYIKYNNYVLNITNGSKNDGTTIDTWKDLSNDAQKWYIYPQGNGYKIYSQYAQKAIGVANNGINVVLNTDNGSVAQTFLIEKVHTYSNSCDTTCNTCGATRSVSHTYSNACDTSCNICGATRSVTHTYSSLCDITCNACGNRRASVFNHSYSNVCDGSCNSCGYTRTPPHSYKTYTTPATTTKDGTEVVKCSICSKVSSQRTIKEIKSIALSSTSAVYNGKRRTPAVIVKDSQGNTISANNYTVTYRSGRINVGKYKVTIKFKDNYSGIRNLYFSILPPKTTVSKLTAGRKNFTANISKKSSQVSGYQVQYATNTKFKNAKHKTIGSYKTTKYTFKNLTAKKTYYVRVRTYKTVNGKHYYSPWSAYKTVKTK